MYMELEKSDIKPTKKVTNGKEKVDYDIVEQELELKKF